MKSYLALIRMDLLLAVRNRTVILINYLLPLVLFFVYSGLFHAERSAATAVFVVSLVLVLGIMSGGLFGAGMRATQEREANILRRYKVAPISPMPLLVASLVTGWVLYVPLLVAIITLAHTSYGMPLPASLLSLGVVVTAGVLAFRALGLIVSSVSNSTQESQLLTQLLFLPMMFLGGGGLPLSMLPPWAKTLSLFMPTSHLTTGIQAVLIHGETAPAGSILALLLTAALGIFIAQKLFRWEKEEKLPGAAKLWVGAVLLPLFAYGAYQMKDQGQLRKAEALGRALQRDSILIRDARVFVGDGQVMEHGTVLVDEGKIQGVYEAGKEPAGLKVSETVEANGKTLLPGLIDAHVHLGGMDLVPAEGEGVDPEKARRALAQDLYAGVTAVRSVGDASPQTEELAASVARDEVLGAELFADGPLFTAQGGHGTEYAKDLPDGLRQVALEATVRTPRTPEEARAQVTALARQGVSGVKAVLEAGQPGMPFNRMDVSILRAVVEQAHASGLPVAVHTGDARDVADALDAGADTIEHGSARDALPEELLAKLATKKTGYDPTLAVLEALEKRQGTDAEELLDAPLVRQLIPVERLAATRKALPAYRERAGKLHFDAAQARDNLLRAWKAGVPLLAGTDAGNLLVVHGASLHRELRLWVQAGIPPAVALQAATSGAAHYLKADSRLGLVKTGYDANLLLVDGNPLQDITATERITLVVFRGERLDRPRLLRQSQQ